MLIFGHNFIGRTIAVLVTTILAVPASLFWGVAMMVGGVAFLAFIFLILYALMRTQVEEWLKELFNFDQFFHYYGFILGIIILGIGTIVCIASIPVIYVGCVITAFMEGMQELINYIFNGTIPPAPTRSGETKQLLLHLLDDMKGLMTGGVQ